jgi:hypothetical protein
VDSQAGLIRRNIADAARLERLDRPDLEPWQRRIWMREISAAREIHRQFTELAARHAA